MKPRIVIVGAGLAGSILCDRLRHYGDVTVVELTKAHKTLTPRVVDTGCPSQLDPFAASGLGGTSEFWHNGLIELEDSDYDSWPIGKSDLLPYLEESYPLLGGTSRDVVENGRARARASHQERGMPEALLGNPIYYPAHRRNLWNFLKLTNKNVACVFGDASHFEIGEDGKANAVHVMRDGHSQRIEGDIFISCAGGLGSPVLIQETAKRAGLSLEAAGRYFHDHPMSWLGRVTVDLKLYDIWSQRLAGGKGVLRTPFVIRNSWGKIAFYWRPSGVNQRKRITSFLTELRNHPFRLENYWNILRNSDDITEALAFKFGIMLPTRSYSILLVAEQPPSDQISISRHEDGRIERKWAIPKDYLGGIREALHELVSSLKGHIVSFQEQEDWISEIHTASHYSGTCRMANDATAGVCDTNLKVFGVDNLYICDGSVIPTSGYCNTGLTISALALRLAERIQRQ